MAKSAADIAPENDDGARDDKSIDPDDLTLATYQAAAQLYSEQTEHPTPASLAFLDRVAAVVPAGRVLELGSGPGWDAAYLEARGLSVTRTDATPAFVDMIRAGGYAARVLDARSDDLGGPYDAVLASAVLLHLDRAQFEDLLHRAGHAVVAGGVLACTLKEGDGSAWSDAKLGLPRHFTFWREGPLREVLARTGWTVLAMDQVAGRVEPWLSFIARAAPS